MTDYDTVWQNESGGSGGYDPNTSRALIVATDFLNGLSGTPFSSGGNGGSVAAAAGEASHPGVLSISTGAAADGSGGILTHAAAIRPGGGQVIVDLRARVPVLSTSGGSPVTTTANGNQSTGQNQLAVASASGFVVGDPVRIRFEPNITNIAGGAVVVDQVTSFYNANGQGRFMTLGVGSGSQEDVEIYYFNPVTNATEIYWQAPGAQNSHTPYPQAFRDKSLHDDYTANGPYQITAIAGNTLTLNRNLAVPVVGGMAVEKDTAGSANSFKAWLGLIDSVLAESTDGIYLEYDESVSPNWRLVSSNNGTQTKLSSSVEIVAGQWFRLTITVNASATSLTFALDGTDVGTITTNIPTGAGRETGIGAAILKTAGTASRSIECDAFFVHQTFS